MIGRVDKYGVLLALDDKGPAWVPPEVITARRLGTATRVPGEPLSDDELASVLRKRREDAQSRKDSAPKK